MIYLVFIKATADSQSVSQVLLLLPYDQLHLIASYSSYNNNQAAIIKFFLIEVRVHTYKCKHINKYGNDVGQIKVTQYTFQTGLLRSIFLRNTKCLYVPNVKFQAGGGASPHIITKYKYVLY